LEIGQIAGLIKDIKPASQIIKDIMEEYFMVNIDLHKIDLEKRNLSKERSWYLLIILPIFVFSLNATISK